MDLQPSGGVIARKTTHHFAANLRGLRAGQDLTQQKAANRIGVTRAAWSQWESSRRFPTCCELDLIAGSLNVLPCRLFHDGPCAFSEKLCAERASRSRNTAEAFQDGPGPLGFCFAVNLLRLRRARGLSEKTAAVKLGVAASTWSQWETGARFPRQEELKDLATLFGQPLCGLLCAFPERSCGAFANVPGRRPKRAR